MLPTTTTVVNLEADKAIAREKVRRMAGAKPKCVINPQTNRFLQRLYTPHILTYLIYDISILLAAAPY